MRKSACGMTALIVATLPLSANAESIVDELRGGVFIQGWGGPGVDKEQGAGINIEALFKSPRAFSVLGAPRPQLGASIATDPDATSQIYAGLEWKVEIARKFFAAASLGGAIHNGETNFDPATDIPRINDTVFLGCRALFRLGGDVGYEVTDRWRLSIHLDHISNAGLCSENEGLDNFGLRLGYRF